VRVLSSPIKLVTLALAAFAGACLDNKLEHEDEVDGSVAFIAKQSDFLSYKDWMPFKKDTPTDHGGVSGTRTVYVNELPVDEKFPLGSILLKTVKMANSDDTSVHAMAKRGNGFNARGAVGWEYFELLLDKTGVPIIMWRGEKPPSGEMYQALPGAKMSSATEDDCNSCHAEGKDGMLGDDIVNLLN
jgi:hypothetical protein